MNIFESSRYMNAHTDAFMEKVFEGDEVYIKSTRGMVSAHGDKTYQYKDFWERHGLEYKKAQIIYFLTYTKVMDRPKPESKEWVVDNYKKYQHLLP